MTMENIEIHDSKIIDGGESNDVNESEVFEDEVNEDENCPELINSGRNTSFHPSDGIISPMDRYNIYGTAIRCMKCDSLYHVQKDCKSTL